MNSAIIVENLSKKYKHNHNDVPQTIMDSVLSILANKKKHSNNYIWALQDLNFRVEFGEMLGVMGSNGSGKSTLLRLISGIGKPSQGKIKINGKLRGLLDLGAGFHDDLTGRENVMIGAMVAGLTRQEINKIFDRIVEFAELQDFLDSPVRTYSSGMRIRLAFSVAIHTNPEILIIDEHIAVGDIPFQEKCLERILELKEIGCAIVFVSQSPQKIQQTCDRALWLQEGKMMAYGVASDVSKSYLASIHHRQAKMAQSQPYPIVNLPGLILTEVKLFPSSILLSGSALVVQINYQLQANIPDFQIRVLINNNEGQVCCISGRLRSTLSPLIPSGTEQIQLHFERLDLSQGQYFVNVVLAEAQGHHIYDAHRNLYTLEIQSSAKNLGFLNPPLHWQFGTVSSEQLS